MDIQIIDNLSGSKNHFSRLKTLFQSSTSVLLASPFLMTDFTFFFKNLQDVAFKHLHLVTTLPPRSIEQIQKVDALISLINQSFVEGGDVNCIISLNNKLHGKVYVFKNEGEYLSAIITSANFTGNGLVQNHEWGVEIFDKNKIRDIEESVLNSIEFPSIEFDEIYNMKSLVDKYSNSVEAKQPTIDLDLTKLLLKQQQGLIANLDDSVRFWLKPIGVTNDPVSEGDLFDSPQEMLNFSKRKPRGIKKGDILIAYGVGSKKVLSVYRVATLPQYVSDKQIEEVSWYARWPWYIIGENLTIKYGSGWWEFPFNIFNLVDTYLKLHPKLPITSTGNQTLGALNYGHDKIKLDKGFAHFVVQKILDANNR